MVECVIQRKVSDSEKAMKWIFIAMTVFLGAIGIATIVMLPAFVLSLIVTIYYSRRLHDEYEYGYNKYTGSLSIARIMNGTKRKTCLDVQLEQVQSIRPYSECWEIKDRRVRVEDYASRNIDARVYVISMQKADGHLRYIIFEPSDEMLQEMKQHFPEQVKLAKVEEA